MTKLRHVILSSLKAAGILAIGAIAPNVIGTMLAQQKRSIEKIDSALIRLEKAGLIHIRDRSVILTSEGARFLSRWSSPAKPKRWDSKWRIVIFDIPESRRIQRRRLRHALQEIGFVRLQDSVWVYPFDCEELVLLLKTEFKVGKDVQYIIADRVENDRLLRQQFQLTK